MARIVFSLLSLFLFYSTAVRAEDQSCRTFYQNQQTREALHHCMPLAAQGDGEASFILSSLYSQGFEGGSSDLQQALRWLTRSAEQGYAPGCYNLAVLYERGDVVAQDLSVAFRWYLQGAKLGHLASQLKTGIAYLKGNGTNQDYAEAKSWLTMAADRGDQSAKITLATLLKATEPEQSVKLFREAAQGGSHFAFYQLALLYREPPSGLTKDLPQALHYASESERLGYAPAVDLVESIKQQQVLEEAHRIALAEHGGALVSDTELPESASVASTATVVEPLSNTIEQADAQKRELNTVALNAEAQKAELNERALKVAAEKMAAQKAAAAQQAADEKAKADAIAAKQAAEEKAKADAIAAKHAADEKAKADAIAAKQVADKKAKAEAIAAKQAADEKAKADAIAAKQVADEKAKAEAIAAKQAADEKAKADAIAAKQAADEKAKADAIAAKQAADEKARADAIAAKQAADEKAKSEAIAAKQADDEKAKAAPIATKQTVDGAAVGLHDFAWLKSQPGKRYVLQLAQLSSDDSVKAYIANNQLKGKVNYFRAVTAGGNKYVVLYAQSAASLVEAKGIAAAQLPKELSGMVWYRTYRAIQRAYKPVD
ncbi:hypothetical protein [Amphritea sp.]|uniref:hypothetical protein n=1 Tax=Amphritea sp. TaxID=1872502 RepID=UPI003A8F74D4